MRKIIFVLTLILTMGFSTTAQAFSFDWGVTGGYNLSKLNLSGHNEDYYNSNNRSGWFVGAKANIGLFMGFGLDGAIIFSQQKYNYNNDGSNYFNYSKTQRCFEIPINLKYSIGLGRLANIYFTTGPQFEYYMGDDEWAWYDEEFQREDITSSWNIGAGAKLFKHLDVGIVYNFGISKFGESVLELGGDNWRPTEAKTSSFKVQLTYYF